jgi:hypothetical protein
MVDLRPTFSVCLSLCLSFSLYLSVSLTLVKKGFSLRKLKKNSKPITAVKQAILENLVASRRLALDCQCHMGKADLQVHRGFFLCLNSLSLSFKI